MMLFDCLYRRVALAVLCLGLAGCKSPQVTAHLSGGYQEVAHPKRFGQQEAELTRVSFEHLGTDGKSALIWPALYGVNEVVKGELAIFVGDKAAVEDGDKVTHPRLFAVKFPELPLDITDEVLWRWSKANGKNIAKTLDKFSLVTPVETDGRLELQLEFYADEKDWPDRSALSLDWNQVAEIMRAVKTKGVPGKDVRWHTPYIGEQF